MRRRDSEAMRFQKPGRSTRGIELKAQCGEVLNDRQGFIFVRVSQSDQQCRPFAACRNIDPRGDHGFV